jgi:broad specificity phosphatase PhoE
MNIATRTPVRHGVTEWAAAARHTSIADMAFTSAREVQAGALRSYPTEKQFDAVYSSPMLRAHTAILTGFANVTLEADSLEWRYGRYEGIVPMKIQEEDPNWSVFRNGAPEGETPDQVASRCDRPLRLWPQQGRHHVFRFSLGHALRALATRWTRQTMGSANHLHLDPGSISRFPAWVRRIEHRPCAWGILVQRKPPDAYVPAYSCVTHNR